jgi:hypothetical protein
MSTTLERTIEAKACLALEKLGCVCLKFGQDGWPDRLVILGKDYPDAVIWIEFKNATGTLQPNQKIRHKQLARAGQTVAICRSKEEALGAVAKARRSIDRARARG